MLLEAIREGGAHQGLPICLCDCPALVALSTYYHHSFVFVLIHIGKWGMALHEHAGVK
jgi:hypothetical protein